MFGAESCSIDSGSRLRQLHGMTDPRTRRSASAVRKSPPQRGSRGARQPDASSESPAASGDALELLGFTRSVVRLLRYFAVHPDTAPHFRHLQRCLGVGSASLQRDLARLVSLGVLERQEDGPQVRYRTVPESRRWQSLRDLVRESSDPRVLAADALCDVPGVAAAFVFGSTARGTSRPDSDLDLFVVEAPTLDRRALNRQMSNLGLLLEREVNVIRYTPQDLGERLGDPGHAAHGFTREVLAGPKHWVAGSPDVLRPLAAAAGLTIEEQPEVNAGGTSP